MELSESVSIDRLNRPIGEALGNFHPGSFQVCLVVALAAETGHRYLFDGAVLFDGVYDGFGFCFCILSCSHSHGGFAL
jgi:hypothetical protein